MRYSIVFLAISILLVVAMVAHNFSLKISATKDECNQKAKAQYAAHSPDSYMWRDGECYKCKATYDSQGKLVDCSGGSPWGGVLLSLLMAALTAAGIFGYLGK